VGLFVAIYTVAALGDGHRSLQILVAGKALLITVWLLTADLQPFNAAGWVFFRIGTALMVAALGESVRTRRVLAAEAQERAERAEQTKEEEARRRVDAERLRIAGRSTTPSPTPSPSSTCRPGSPPTYWTNAQSRHATRWW
jgi:hypothetical protein